MSRSSRPASSRLGCWGMVGVLTAYFLGLSWLTTSSRIAPLDLALLGLVYLLLSAFLWSGALCGARLGRLAAFAGSLPIAAVTAWHFREQTLHPAGREAFAIAVLGPALVWTALARWIALRGALGVGRLAAAAGGLALAFALAVAGLYHASDTFRWHLLRHNKVVGTAAYFLLARPVEAIEREVWAAHESEPGPQAPAAHGPARSRATDAPNIIFVLADTLRADSLAAYGGSPDLMPNLNRLAEQSFVFGDVMANASWTRPSVASFFTGLPQELHGAVDRRHALPPERFTIAEALREAGYRTAAFVSNFGAVSRDAGFDQGFDSFEEVKDPRTPYARAEVVNRAVASWLARSARGDRAGSPVFLYIHYLDPHLPYLSGCDGGCSAHTHAQARRSYEKQLRYLDDQLRWVTQDLAARLAGRTVLLVTSDHGEEFGEHGERGHGHSLYREVLHVPAIVHTGASSAGRIEAKLEARDFFDLIVRVATDPAFEVGTWGRGRARTGRYASIDSTTPSAFYRPYLDRVFMRALERDGTLLIWSAYGVTHELYDLGGDPAQRTNLARIRRDAVGQLSAAMEERFPHWAKRVPMTPTEQSLEMLRALGYVE